MKAARQKILEKICLNERDKRVPYASCLWRQKTTRAHRDALLSIRDTHVKEPFGFLGLCQLCCVWQSFWQGKPANLRQRLGPKGFLLLVHLSCSLLYDSQTVWRCQECHTKRQKHLHKRGTSRETDGPPFFVFSKRAGSGCWQWITVPPPFSKEFYIGYRETHPQQQTRETKKWLAKFSIGAPKNTAGRDKRPRTRQRYANRIDNRRHSIGHFQTIISRCQLFFLFLSQQNTRARERLLSLCCCYCFHKLPIQRLCQQVDTTDHPQASRIGSFFLRRHWQQNIDWDCVGQQTRGFVVRVVETNQRKFLDSILRKLHKKKGTLALLRTVG